MTRTATLWLLVVATSVACGCFSNPFLGKPQLLDPGSEELQQFRAQRFDPYPDLNIGPRVDGGRPDSYTQPPPEPVRGTKKNPWGAIPFR